MAASERSSVIYARRCSVAVIPEPDAREFVQKHHRSGTVSATTTSIGLIHDGALVGVMQFCYPRTSAKRRQYSTEMVRMCFSDGVRVIGGASRMFRFYIDRFDPHDVFCYQDTTGEVTDVYERCGMTLVSQDESKQYLVAAGESLATAILGDTMHTVPFVVAHGPDKILGTSLGEVRDEDGRRRTNIQLFQDLGWQLVTTSGDRTYEWINPDRTFYVYRITAPDSDKWYVGVHHLKWAGATERDALEDGYWGSGGVKFQNWWTRHWESAEKTVIATGPTVMFANDHEVSEVGNAWDIDPYCLNSQPGGYRLGGWYAVPWVVKECAEHGSVPHIGSTCARCRAENGWTLADCLIHGETVHHGSTCWACHLDRTWTTTECPLHGETTSFNGECWSCKLEADWSVQNCSVHGPTKHNNGICYRCSAATAWTIRDCPVHGMVMHNGSTCQTCMTEAMWTLEDCAVHGETKHLGGACWTCKSEETWSVRTCPVHGETAHNGTTCQKCMAEVQWSVKECSTHGLTKHIGDTCQQCTSDRNWSMKECAAHGMTMHIGSECRRCISDRAWAVRECPIHGETKHNGASCSRCTGERIAHTRWHVNRDLIDPECRLCVPEDSMIAVPL